MAAPETAPPPHHSRDLRVHRAPADTRAACSAALAAVPRGASWTSGSSRYPLAAARRAPPLERSTPRASRARVLHLLRPSCGPAESPGPARPFLAACATGRSYALLEFPLSGTERGSGGEDLLLRSERLASGEDSTPTPNAALDKSGHTNSCSPPLPVVSGGGRFARRAMRSFQNARRAARNAVLTFRRATVSLPHAMRCRSRAVVSRSIAVVSP